MKKIILFSTLFIISIINAQKLQTDSIKHLERKNTLREKVFIHTNKTSYLANETIWFSAYVGEDISNKPSWFTSNLHVNLLNSKGEVITSKVLFIKNGIGFGEFQTDDNFISDDYYVIGFTNFMRNFGKENVFVQKIKILNTEKKKNISSKNSDNKYELQVFPESGYLLENTENTVGIKLLINGKGYPFEGKIVNSQGEDISFFHGNHFGMSASQFYYNESEVYTAIIQVNDTIKKITIPKALKTGLIFSLDNTDTNKLKLTIKTNKNSLATLRNDELSLLAYRNNHVLQAIDIIFKEQSETTQVIYFDKSSFLNGVNTITIFRNKQPIAERKFFIEKSIEKTSLLVEETLDATDSIQYKVKILDANLKPVTAQLSISILPKKSELFSENQNIKSAFLLSPYVKGIIENPSYYFNDKYPKRKKYLDLLLLNQGWSTYTLEEKVRKINPTIKYPAEYGFTLKGIIKRALKNYDLGLLSKKNEITTFSTINKDGEFYFENVFAYKNDTARIALIKKEKSLLKPSRISFINTKNEMDNYNYLVSKFNDKDSSPSKISRPTTYEKETFDFTEHGKIINLDEVKLRTVKLIKEKSSYEKKLNIASRRRLMGADFYRNVKITEEIEKTSHTLNEYFEFIGLSKNNMLVMKRNQYSSNSFSGSQSPIIYLDDIKVPYDTFLQTFSMSDVDEILINSSGVGGGVISKSGIIRIYTKKGDHKYYDGNSENLYKNLILLTGFDKANAYYKPQYNIYSKETLNRTEIDWISKLETNKEGIVSFKVSTNEFSNEYQLIINGLSTNGLLIHQIYKTSDYQIQ